MNWTELSHFKIVKHLYICASLFPEASFEGGASVQKTENGWVDYVAGNMKRGFWCYLQKAENDPASFVPLLCGYFVHRTALRQQIRKRQLVYVARPS